MKKLMLGLLTALTLTIAAGCGTDTNKKEQNSTTQNNETNKTENDVNSVADDNGTDNTLTTVQIPAMW